MWKYVPLYSVMAAVIALDGCADFRDADEDQPDPAPATAQPALRALAPPAPSLTPLPKIEEPPLSLSISYAIANKVTEKRTTLRPADPPRRPAERIATLQAESVITLPLPVPDSLRLKAVLPHYLNRQGISMAVAPQDRPMGKTSLILTRVVTDSDGSASITTDLSGIRNVLSDSAEDEKTLRISLKDVSGNALDLDLRLRTPPLTLQASQTTVQEFESQNGALPSATKMLRSLMVRLDLLQIIKIHNPARSARVLTLPLKPNGMLVTHVTTAQASVSWCSYTLASQDQEQVLSSDIYFLPIDERLSRSFASFIDQALPDNAFTMTLEPGTTLLIGIYAAGPQVAALMEGGHPQSSLQPLVVPTSCRSRCGDPSKDAYHWDALHKAEMYWASQGWPGASRICSSLKNTRIPISQAYPNEAGMNQCAEWELYNGLAPWDERRFCQSMPPGNPWHYIPKEYWIVAKATTTVMVGTQTYPIQLVLDPASIVARMRYEETASTEAAEVRLLPQLIAAATKQAD